LRSAPIRERPSALERFPELRAALGPAPAVFLDYDGTLTPIVEEPDRALLPEPTREVLGRLAARTQVAIVSGRDLEDVRGKVGLDGVAYAGSHGLDLLHADGKRERRGEGCRAALDEAAAALAPLAGRIRGLEVERKRYAIAVHTRRVAAERRDAVRDRVAEVASAHPELRRVEGKRVHELRPDLDWDKGRVVLHLLERTGWETALYLGDDVTDEDAFGALEAADRGVGVVVRGEDDGRVTRASFSLEDPAASRALLSRLADALRDG